MISGSRRFAAEVDTDVLRPAAVGISLLRRPWRSSRATIFLIATLIFNYGWTTTPFEDGLWSDTQRVCLRRFGLSGKSREGSWCDEHILPV